MKKLMMLAATAVLFAVSSAHAADLKAVPIYKAPAPQQTIVQAAHAPVGLGSLGILSNLAVLGVTTTNTMFFTKTFTFTKLVPFKVPDGFKWVKIHHKWVKVPQYKIVKKPVEFTKEKTVSKSNKSVNGKAVVGCIFGMASGAILAAVHKSAINGDLYWRSQAEHEAEVRAGVHLRNQLTNDEAATAMAACGLGSFLVMAQQQPGERPVVARF